MPVRVNSVDLVWILHASQTPRLPFLLWKRFSRASHLESPTDETKS